MNGKTNNNFDFLKSLFLKRYNYFLRIIGYLLGILFLPAPFCTFCVGYLLYWLFLNSLNLFSLCLLLWFDENTKKLYELLVPAVQNKEGLITKNLDLISIAFMDFVCIFAGLHWNIYGVSIMVSILLIIRIVYWTLGRLF